MNISRLKAWMTMAAMMLLAGLGPFFGPAYAGLVFGLAGLLLLLDLVVARRLPRIEPHWLLLAGLLVGLGWVSLFWAFDLGRGIRSGLQLSGILVGVLALHATCVPMAENDLRRFDQLLGAAFLASAAYLVVRWSIDIRVSGSLAWSPMNTRWNRGIIYGLLLSWPLLSWRWGRWKAFIPLLLAVWLAVLVSASTTAKAAILVGYVMLVLAWCWPGWVEKAIGAGMLLALPALPFLLRLLEHWRTDLNGRLKFSAMHRLELWDHFSARVIEQPWLGWGLGSASVMPISPEEAQSYLWAKDVNYPHNQFLQLWVDLGAAGMALVFAGLLLLLAAIRRQPRQARPFAYAALATALTVALTDYEYITDSWWAALAATILLFRLFRLPGEQ